MTDPRVVVIEDDPQLRRFLKAVLGDAGYDVYVAESGERGLIEAGARRPDVILLDLGLPDLDGFEVLARLRHWSSTPVIILSARGDEVGKVRALDAGADDYLVKPFGSDELLARLRVARRHAARTAQGDEVFESGGVRIDLAAHSVVVRGACVHLTVTEFKLLGELVRAAGRVLTHRQLLTAVWGPTHAGDTHYLRLYMAQLRSKLEQDPADPQLLLTEVGVGYRLAVGDEP
jgi:two-component system KDP operon response regulator KdpE